MNMYGLSSGDWTLRLRLVGMVEWSSTSLFRVLVRIGHGESSMIWWWYGLCASCTSTHGLLCWWQLSTLSMSMVSHWQVSGGVEPWSKSVTSNCRYILCANITVFSLRFQSLSKIMPECHRTNHLHHWWNDEVQCRGWHTSESFGSKYMKRLYYFKLLLEQVTWSCPIDLLNRRSV